MKPLPTTWGSLRFFVVNGVVCFRKRRWDGVRERLITPKATIFIKEPNLVEVSFRLYLAINQLCHVLTSLLILKQPV